MVGVGVPRRVIRIPRLDHGRVANDGVGLGIRVIKQHAVACVYVSRIVFRPA